MIAKLLIAFVAVEHVYFLVLEMFLWNKDIGRKTFRLSQEFADASLGLARNQGLYNGFLAAGLVWALFAAEEQSLSLRTFFLSCVVVWRAHGVPADRGRAGGVRRDRAGSGVAPALIDLLRCSTLSKTAI